MSMVWPAVVGTIQEKISLEFKFWLFAYGKFQTIFSFSFQTL